jgi:hypothetical protein
MRGERETDTDSLMARYGVGRRLATRIVALLSRSIDVSGTLLAEAGAEEPLTRLLLDPELLRDPGVLQEGWVHSRARELGFQEADLLRVVVHEETGWRTLALEDDLLAEGAVASGVREDDGLALVAKAPHEITTRETQELFTPEEVARLKLAVLTSQNSDERIEALRKLVFAPMSGPQKAGVFVTVLTDREAEPRVRREAIRSLEQIGFRSDMAEAIRNLFTESTEDAVYAVQRLGSLLREAEQGEAAVVLAVLLEVLDHNQDLRVVRELLRLIARQAGLLVTNYQKTESFAQSALRQLVRDFDELRLEVEDALDACAKEAPDLVGGLLWQELRRADSPRVRSLLLGVIEGLPRTATQLADLAERAVTELLNPMLPESEKARLRYALVRVGEPAVLVGLGRIADATGVQRSECIRLLDVVCTESQVSDETLTRAVRALLDLLKLGDTVTRRSVVQASVLADPRLPGDLQRELSAELLSLMAELNLPDSLDLIQNALRRIGPEALEPAYEFVRSNYPSEAGERTVLVLADIVENHPGEVEEGLARRVYDLCNNLLADDGVENGAFVMALAAVCGHTEWGAGVFDGSFQYLKSRVWSLPYSMDVLDALAMMAGSRNIGPAQQQELFGLFDAIVRFRARTGIGVRRKTEHGVVYEFGREIQYDIRAVPAAVRGLERICVSERAPGELRAEIAKRLLILWEGVSKVRIIWGPAAVDALIRAMCAAACCGEASVGMRVRLGASLLRFLNKVRVIDSIGQICSQPDDSEELRRLALQACGDMLREWDVSAVQDEERRLALLKAAARIACNPALDAAEETVHRLRERTLQALFSGLRSGMDDVRDSLLMMRECPGIGEAQVYEIDERIAKAFGLIRVGRGG